MSKKECEKCTKETIGTLIPEGNSPTERQAEYLKESMQTINLDYDKQFDILYARFPFTGHSYGEEDKDGVITYRHIEKDYVTGIAVQDFKQRLNAGDINLKSLPIPLDTIITEIRGRI